MLYRIEAKGVRTFCTDLIVDPERREWVYFLSVAGYQTAVKGILANLMENHPLEIAIDGRNYTLNRTQDSYAMRIRRMPSGYCHGITFPKTAFPRKEEEESSGEALLIGDDPQGFVHSLYRHLEAGMEIPLHPGWAQWLWTLHEKKGWLVKLETLAGRYQGCLATLDPEMLLQELTLAMKAGVSEIVACMGG